MLKNSWCKQIFNDSHSIVINLMLKFFEEFNKNFAKLVADHLFAPQGSATTTSADNHAAVYLDYLSQYKQEIDQFTFNIYSSTEIAIKSQAQQSQHLYELLIKLFQCVYAPFKSNLRHYTSHLVRFFTKSFEANVRMTHADIVDNVQLLQNSVLSVFGLIDNEMERCSVLTNNCCFSMLIDAVKTFLKCYVDEFRRVVLNLRERKKQSGHTSTSSSSHNFNAASSAAAATAISANELENWSLSRHFVRIIQIVGDLIIKYENLEEAMEKKILESFVYAAQQQTHDLNLLSVSYFKDYYLLDDSDRNKLNNIVSYVETGSDYTLMKELNSPLNALSECVHKYSFDIVFAPIKFLLRDLAKQTVWLQQSDEASTNSAAIPMFALVPQEYITKIGQYLLTLPQNFESFTMQDSTSLIIALRKGHLPYLDEKDLSDDLLACWLDSIANATYVTLSDEVLKFERLSVNSQRQLIIDIEFICSVFDDVGLKDYSNLLTVLELLKLDEPEDFEERLKNKSARVISFIRRIKATAH